MSLYAYDAAYQPDLAAVKAAGGIAINHYLTGIYSSTSTQPAEALAAGLGSILTYEEGPSELVGASRAYGQTVGHKILNAVAALKIVPLDGSVAVYPSVDVNAPAGACDQAFLGIRDVIDGKLSLRDYSEGAIIDHLAAGHETQGRAWLAAPTSWPGFNASDPNVVMVQLVGTNVPGTDRNLVLDPAALGALWPADSPYGDQMSFTIDDVRALVREELQYALAYLSKGGENTRFNSSPAGGNLPATGGVKVTSGVADPSAALAALTAQIKTLGTTGAVAPTAFTGTISLTAK